jgi:hypothetical protein
VTAQTWTSFGRDITQTLFFIAVGTVTVLTYLKAKRTILQPIRTETFKEQLRAFTEVLRLFGGKRRSSSGSIFTFRDCSMSTQ